MRLRPPLRDSQDEPAAAFCARCAGEIYAGGTLYDWDGQRICSDCFKAKLMLWMELSPRQVANALNVPFAIIT